MRSTDRGRSRRRKAGRALDASVSGSARRVPRGQVIPQRRELRADLLFFLCGGRGREEVAGESNGEKSEEKRSTREKRIPEARRRARRGHARVLPYLAMRSRDNSVALPSRCGCVGASRRGSPAPTRGRSTRACHENVKCAGVSRTPRRNVGFRFASLALEPTETLELRAAFGVARAVGSRAACADVWSRASRGAYCLRAPRRCDETLSNVSSSLFALQKRPFLPARHVKGERERDEDGGGLGGSCVALFVFKPKSPVFFVASSVRFEARLKFGPASFRRSFRFETPRADGKISSRGNLPNYGRTPNATRRFRI